jgi:hypothetical protein
MESYLDTHLRVAPVVLIASEDVWFLGNCFPTPCPVLGPRLNEVGLWVGKEKFSASKYGIIFGNPLDVSTRGLDCELRRVVLGMIFPNSVSRSSPTFERNGIMSGKTKFHASKNGTIFGYPFEGCTCVLDCERRRVVLGPRFCNSVSHSRPVFEQSGIMGGNTMFSVSKYGIIFGYPFEGSTRGLDCE